MSFFKEFKEDFSQAVNDLMPTDGAESKNDNEVVNTLDDDVDLQAELDKLDDIWASDENEKKASDSLFVNLEEENEAQEENVSTERKKEVLFEDKKVEQEEVKEKPHKIELKKEEKVQTKVQEELPKMDTSETNKEAVEKAVSYSAQPVSNSYDTSEVAVITKGMTINGDVEASGPIEIRGIVNGNVKSSGKIVVTGTLKGDANSKEFYADNAHMDGEINTEGTVKIGNGSVIKGNITAQSSVIAGAVKGDIDIHGPVVVDTSAVVMGNIKSKSVQINNGAVIEGFCSQCYADIDVKNLFGEE